VCADEKLSAFFGIGIGDSPRHRRIQLLTTGLNNTGSKSFFEKITCLPNQMSLFLCEIITTESLDFFQRFDQLKLLVSAR